MKHTPGRKKGHKHTMETRLKMSLSRRGAKHHMYGKHHTEASKQKISENRKGLAAGVNHPMYGKHHTDAAKEKLRIANTGKKTGANNPLWKGGVSKNKKHVSEMKNRRNRLLRALKRTYTAKEWEDLKTFYEFTCLRCKKSEPDIKITLDHITPLCKGGLDDIANIQPLCQGCNSAKRCDIIDYRRLTW